jgi:hypothetical protein
MVVVAPLCFFPPLLPDEEWELLRETWLEWLGERPRREEFEETGRDGGGGARVEEVGVGTGGVGVGAIRGDA